MSYDFGRAPPVFAECVLTRFEEFKAAHLALKTSLETETKRIDRKIQEDLRSYIREGRCSGAGADELAKKMKESEDKALLEKVTTVFIDTLWPTSKWANNAPRNDVQAFFDREIPVITKQLSIRRDKSLPPTYGFYELLSTVVEAAQKQPDQKKEESKLQKNELSASTFSDKNFKFYDFGRAPPAFAECALTCFEEFKTAHLALKTSLETETKRIDRKIQEDLRSYIREGRCSGAGADELAKKMKESEDKALLEKVTTVFIDTLWPTSKWANNAPRNDVQAFFDREIPVITKQLSIRRDKSLPPTYGFYELLSTVVNEVQYQLKQEN